MSVVWRPKSGQRGLTPSMRTIGASDDWTSSAASERCLQSSMSVAVRPCCCTSCCTDLTLSCQRSSSVRLSPATLVPLAFRAGPLRCYGCRRHVSPLCGKNLSRALTDVARPAARPLWSTSHRAGPATDTRCPWPVYVAPLVSAGLPVSYPGIRPSCTRPHQAQPPPPHERAEAPTR